MVIVDLEKPMAQQLQAVFSAVSLNDICAICSSATDGLLAFQQSRRASELLACVPGLSTIQGEFEFSIGDEGQSYRDWVSASLWDDDGRTITFTSYEDIEMAIVPAADPAIELFDTDGDTQDHPAFLSIPEERLPRAHQLCWDILMSVRDYDGEPLSLLGLATLPVR